MNIRYISFKELIIVYMKVVNKSFVSFEELDHFKDNLYNALEEDNPDIYIACSKKELATFKKSKDDTFEVDHKKIICKKGINIDCSIKYTFSGIAWDKFNQMYRIAKSTKDAIFGV